MKTIYYCDEKLIPRRLTAFDCCFVLFVDLLRDVFSGHVIRAVEHVVDQHLELRRDQHLDHRPGGIAFSPAAGHGIAARDAGERCADLRSGPGESHLLQDRPGGVRVGERLDLEPQSPSLRYTLCFRWLVPQLPSTACAAAVSSCVFQQTAPPLAPVGKLVGGMVILSL
ncbi:MAG: hypothetical protein WEC73_00430 [Chthoniobacterales bacterium]